MSGNRRLISNDNYLLYILTVVSIMLTVSTMPKERDGKYTYSVGKPWTYEVLIAPFSFSIEKDPEVLQAELDSVRNNFQPYFSRQESVRRNVIDNFDRLAGDSLGSAISQQAYASVRRRLVRVYMYGILAPEAEEMIEHGKYVKLTEGNVSSPTPADSLRSVRDAYRYITQAPMSAEDRNNLLKFHLEDILEPDVAYDKSRSESDLKAQLEQVSQYSGMVMADQKIIDQGEMVDKEKNMAIKSYLEIANERASSKRFQMLTWTGQTVFVIICYLFLMFYLSLYRADEIENRTILFFLYSFVTLFNVGVGLYCQYAPWSVVLIPCTILAIVLRIFIDSRTAFMGYMVFVLTTSVCVSLPYEYVMLQTVAGLTGIYSLKDLSQRSQILRTCLLIFLSYCIVWIALRMIHIEDIRGIDPMIFLLFAINSILVLLVYPLLFVIEKSFGFTSNVTLIELSNINNPLLRELAEKAPGTFQHSMQVSTLAAEAATAIKANSQLVRTAALYHDIGKIDSAPFFTENQNGVNPHDRLTPQQSARIITDHVEAGLALADKHGLPSAIRMFIATHHGKGTAKYFYTKFKQEHPDMEPDKETFSYPGPNPFTKETAILMMADAAEAASRSLREYTEETIGALVDRIVDGQVADGYFRDCPISWKEIGKIKDTFKDKLRTMYHTRISYPEESVTVGPRQN